VVVAFEERVFDLILAGAEQSSLLTTRFSPRSALLSPDMELRGGKTHEALLVLNLDVRDSAAEAGVAAPLALGLCRALQEAAGTPAGWEGRLESILHGFEVQHGRRPLYAVAWY
jgi:hypothetical protein